MSLKKKKTLLSGPLASKKQDDVHAIPICKQHNNRQTVNSFHFKHKIMAVLKRFSISGIAHFRVLSAKPFLWKCVSPTSSFSCKSNSFSHEKFCTDSL